VNPVFKSPYIIRRNSVVSEVKLVRGRTLSPNYAYMTHFRHCA